MSEMDVISAFMDGQRKEEPPLSTDGKCLYLRDKMIATNREGNVSTDSENSACVDESLKVVLADFAEWRKQRAKVLRLVVEGVQAGRGPHRLAGGPRPAAGAPQG